MAKDQKIAALFKAVKTIKKKLFRKLNHIVSAKGKVSETNKPTIHNCIQAQIDLLKNSHNIIDTNCGPDFKIYESECFLRQRAERTPRKLPTLSPGNRRSTITYQLPCDFLEDIHPGDLSVDYVNICQSPPPPLPPRRSLAPPPPVFRRCSVTTL